MDPRRARLRASVFSTFSLVGVLVLSACARRGAGPAASASAGTAGGEELLQSACTSCHDLGGLGAFASAFGEAEWRGLIDRMVVYGAPLTAPEVDTLVAYLGANFGTERSDGTDPP